MSDDRRRVVKVGGSLLVRADLPEAVRRWFARQQPAKTLLIFGGGETIDAIRRLDRIHKIAPEVVHWLCVDLLQASFSLASVWFADWPRVNRPLESPDVLWQSATEDRPTLVSVRTFYRQDNASDLPCHWGTTTDAIAAELATRAGAGELVLLKSCPVDPGADPQRLADQGIVDRSFPAAAAGIPRIRVEQLP